MGNQCATFMPLLTELGALGDGFCYKPIAPNGAHALQHTAFQQSQAHLHKSLRAVAAPLRGACARSTRLRRRLRRAKQGGGDRIKIRFTRSLLVNFTITAAQPVS